MTDSDTSGPAARTSGSRLWAIWLKAGVTLLLLWWVFWKVDFGGLGLALRQLELAVICGALALVIAQHVVLAWRWHRILKWMGAPWSFTQSLRWVLVGLFFNQVLPTTVGGDAVRVWALHRHGIPMQVAFGSVAVERGSGLALLAIVISLAVVVASPALGPPEVGRALIGSALLVLSALSLALFADKWLMRWLPARLAEAGARFGAAMRSLFGAPRAVAEIAAGGFVATWLGLLAAVVIGRGLGMQYEISVFVAFVGGAILLTLLPVSVGGWGIREAGMMALFSHVGAQPERVVALSVLWGILPLLVAIPGGAYFWLARRRNRNAPSSAGIS